MNSRDLLLLARLYNAGVELPIVAGFRASSRRLEGRGLLYIGPGGGMVKLSNKGRRLCNSVIATIEGEQVDDAG